MLKILMVEDELIIADNLFYYLKKLNYKPLDPVINYTQAVNLVQKEKPDFAILDINLSGKKDGIDVARYLIENHPIPFIFLTAFGDDETLRRAVEVRPAAYLMKPFNQSELKPTIEIACLNFQYRINKEKPSKVDLFTEMERKVVEQIAQNKTTTEIAEQLNVSASTIKNHRHRICAKLELPPTNNALLTWVMKHSNNI